MKSVVTPVDLQHVWSQTHTLLAPFSFETTVRKPSHFPTPLESFPDDRTYLVIAHVGGDTVGLRLRSESADTVVLDMFAPRGRLHGDAGSIADELARRVGLLVDVTGFDTLWRSDSKLSSLPSRLSGGRPSAPHSLFGFLMICVLLQNTQVRRTVQMMQTMLGRFPALARFPDGTVLPSLWRPTDVLASSEEELRSLRLGYRAKTILRLARQFDDDPGIEDRLLAQDSPNDLRTEISSLYGVGPATAGYLSFEWFKNLDDLVHLSPWETKIVSQLLLGKEASADLVITESQRRWSPFSMLAIHALFESVFWKRRDGEGPPWLEELIRL